MERTKSELAGLQASAGVRSLHVQFYPQRAEEPSQPVALTPSQAVRFVDDPRRVAAAAETAATQRLYPGTPAPDEVDREQPIHQPEQSAAAADAPVVPAPAPAAQPGLLRRLWARLAGWRRSPAPDGCHMCAGALVDGRCPLGHRSKP